MFLICVALQVFLVVLGHSDVIIIVGVNEFGDPHYRPTRVTFSEKYFNQFYKCLCEQKTVCKARYDSSENVTEVWHEDQGIYSRGGPSYYYSCTYEATQKIACERSVASLYYEAFHVLGTECRHSCIGLFWFYPYERTDFRKSGLSVQYRYCYDHNCNCSESNTAATTRTTTTTTTATTTIKTAITTTAVATATTATTATTLATTASATTTTTTIPSSTTIKTKPETSSTRESTPASPASILPKNESGHDPQVGLIIGVVFTIIIIAFIIAVIGIFLWRRKRKQGASIPLNGTQNSTASNNFNNIISEVGLQTRFTKTRNNYPYNVAPSYYNNINSNCENNGNFAREATSLSSENSIKNFHTKSPKNDLENIKTSPERSRPTDDTEAVTPSPTHNSQTANQLSRCSFVRPISDGLSNENTDLIAETNNAAASQNHIYYILEGGKEDDDITDSQRNIYFELEKQEDVSETDTEED